MLDSLVRVSRRVNENRIVSIASEQGSEAEEAKPKTGEHCSTTKGTQLRNAKNRMNAETSIPDSRWEKTVYRAKN